MGTQPELLAVRACVCDGCEARRTAHGVYGPWVAARVADTRHKTDVEKRCNQSDGTQASSAAWCDDEGDKQLAGILDAGGDARIALVHSCTRTICLSVSGDGVWSTGAP